MGPFRQVLIALAFTLVGNSPVAAAPLDRVTLQLKWTHQFQFAGYYAAIAQGYYREAGLEVVLREAVPGRDPVETVLKGEAEFGVGNSDLLLLRHRGEPVVVLAAIFQHSPLVLLVRAASRVADLQGLHDRELMMLPSESAELFAYFKFEGIDPAKLRIRTHTMDIEDFIAGRVDGMSAYGTDEPFNLRARGVPFLQFTPRAGGIDFYGDNLFTTERELKLHPGRVRAFRAASLRGWEYALAHPDEILDLILRDYRRKMTREHLQFEAEQTSVLMHPGLIEVGHMNPGRWRHMADTYAEFGMLPRDFSLVGFLYDPDPRPDLRWVYWSLAGAGVLTVAVLGWALPLVRLNRRLHASERQYRELADNAPFPVAITDLETSRVLFHNRRAADLFGDGLAGDYAGETALSFYHDPAEREVLLKELRAGRSVTGLELRFHSRDGRTIWAELSAGIVAFGDRPAVVVSFHDITRRRAMESELREAKETAEAADAAKGRYLGMLSHEIRTPLNGMLGMINLLRPEKFSSEGREQLEILDHSGRTLLKLINDLLDFARFDSGRVELERLPVEPQLFVRELCTLFRPAAEAKGVRLRADVRPEVPAVVLTDPMRLRQVLSNLLANAIKFTAVGGIEIGVERAPFAAATPGRCRLRFHVSDTGIGIAPEKVAYLFEPYVQADASVARRYGGTGLGLSISKRLAQLFGGGIQVQSAPGTGSVFTVEIEVDVAPPAQKNPGE